MLERKISKKIKNFFKEYPVISLTGPRQAGKTTLIKNIFPDLDYVNLEDVETREFALNDPKGFLRQYKKSLIIDEVQRAPDLLSYIQVMVDEKQKTGQYILTGSQNLLLLEKITQSLAGRTAILKLLPLSLEELKSNNLSLKNKEIEEVLFKGFYPRLFSRKMDIKAYYSNYIQTYLERDVRNLKGVFDFNTFKRFLTLCAARSGQILNISSLALDCGIERNTAKAWLSVLEASFVIYLLQPYYKNHNKRVIKMPKIYFYDTGLLCALLNIENSETLYNHYLKGGIFESFVVSEFLKQRHNQGEVPNLYFWRDKTGNEIDILVDNPEDEKIIEIKSSKTVTQDHFKGLNYYNKIVKGKTKTPYLIYGGDGQQKRKEGEVVSWKNIDEIKI